MLDPKDENDLEQPMLLPSARTQQTPEEEENEDAHQGIDIDYFKLDLLLIILLIPLLVFSIRLAIDMMHEPCSLINSIIDISFFIQLELSVLGVSYLIFAFFCLPIRKDSILNLQVPRFTGCLLVFIALCILPITLLILGGYSIYAIITTTTTTKNTYESK